MINDKGSGGIHQEIIDSPAVQQYTPVRIAGKEAFMTDSRVLHYYQARFIHNLDQFIGEVSLFPEELLWKTPGTISNSAGVLIQHMIGNLNHFFGHALGGTGYTRRRDQEFDADPGTGKSQLEDQLKHSRELVDSVLSEMRMEMLDGDFPAPVFGNETMNCLEFMLHLFHHLSYHAGQLNYLRRAME